MPANKVKVRWNKPEIIAYEVDNITTDKWIDNMETERTLPSTVIKLKPQNEYFFQISANSQATSSMQSMKSKPITIDREHQDLIFYAASVQGFPDIIRKGLCSVRIKQIQTVKSMVYLNTEV